MTATLTRPAPAAAPALADRHRRWERPALAALLLGTAVLYLWNLDANGWGNAYYAAAVQAMTQDWTAFFFGSVDPGNVVTVDKFPASLWVMALSGRLFGFSSWSLLAPQALMGVGAVALLYTSVRRVASPGAALLAGAALALTPVAALMFRFDNPDALLVLLLVAAAYATVRAVEAASTRWLLLAGGLVGFAFLAKMTEALVVLPALAMAYLVAAPTGLARRVRQLLTAGLAVVIGAGWWIAIAELRPSGSRPWIGGTTGDSAWELALGGLTRLAGGSGPGGFGGGVPRGVPDAGGTLGRGGFAGVFGGEPGLTRMFGAEIGAQVAWLLPAALVLLVAGLWLRRRASRTDARRASLLLWGGWTVVTGLVFSLMSGTFHSYYTVALAPGIAALVGIGGHELWRRRDAWGARAVLAGVVAGTAVWSWVLLGRPPELVPWLRWAVLAVGAAAALGLLLAVARRRLVALTVLATVIAGLAGPATYTLVTVGSSVTGSLPKAGLQPEGEVSLLTGGEEEVSPELVALLQDAGTRWSAATLGAQTGSTLQLASGMPVISIGGFTGSDQAPTLGEFQAMVAAGEVRYLVEGGGIAAGDFGGGRGGAPADLDRLGTAAADPQLAEVVGRPAMGGGGSFGGGPGSAISEWVAEHYTATTVGGRTVYDLAAPTR